MKLESINKMDRKSIKKHIDYLRQHSRSSVLDNELLEKQVKKIIHRSVAVNYPVGVVEAYQLLAIVNMNKEDGEMAFNALKMSETFLGKYQLPKEHYLELYNTMVIYYQDYIGDGEMAANMCQKGIVLAKELGNKTMLMKLTANLGSLHILLGNYEDAITYSQSVLSYYTSINDSKSRLYCLSNLGEAYLGIGKYKESQVYYQEAMDLAVKSKEDIILEKSAVGLSRLYRMNEEDRKAASILEEVSKKIQNNTKLNLGIKIVIELIKYYLSKDDYIMADVHMKRFEDDYNLHRNAMVEMDYYQLKSLIAVGFGDFKEAYRMNEQHHVLYIKADEAKANKILSNIKTGQLIGTIERLEKIGNVGRKLTTNLSNDNMIMTLYSELASLVAMDSIGIGIIEGDRVDYAFFQGDLEEYSSYQVPLNDKESFGNWVISNNKALMINDVSAEYNTYVSKVRRKFNQLDGKVTEAIIYVPLAIEDKVIGVLSVQSYNAMAYASQDLETLKVIGSYITIAVMNANQEKELQRLSNTDYLTGVLNRKGLIDCYNKFDDELIDSVHMIMMDLDYFKQINDKYGHGVGDQVLERVGALLMNEADDSLVVRLGGEEFAVILKNVSDAACLDRAHKIIEGVRSIEIAYGSKMVRLTTSLGIYHNHDKKAPSLDQIYKYADRALYLAKSHGRDGLEVYS